MRSGKPVAKKIHPVMLHCSRVGVILVTPPEVVLRGGLWAQGLGSAVVIISLWPCLGLVVSVVLVVFN